MSGHISYSGTVTGRFQSKFPNISSRPRTADEVAMKSKKFANGIVYVHHTHDGLPIETTDTFLPYYTKNATGGTNALRDGDLGSRAERWMVGVSVASGCPIGCLFCATGKLKRYRPLTAQEMVDQVDMIVANNPDCDPRKSREFKINYTRMGEPFLNTENVRQAIAMIEQKYPGTHHYVSTIGIRGSDFSWITGNITLQVSLHSLDEDRRNHLIPFRAKMSISDLGAIRTTSDQKITVNLTLVDTADFDIVKLRQYFDPEHFFIKLSPINENAISVANGLGGGVIEATNLV